MQSDQLNPHEVIARRNTRRHRELLPPKPLAIHSSPHGIHAPDSGRRDRVRSNLEPREASLRSTRRVADTSEVHLRGSVVGSSDRVVGVIGTLGTTEAVCPSSRHRGAGGDGDDLRGSFACCAADQAARGDVLDRVVVWWSAHGDELALVDAGDFDLLHDGVGVGRGGERQG